MSRSLLSEEVVGALRQMAWQRVKGELRGIVDTFEDPGEQDEMDDAVKQFIVKMEHASPMARYDDGRHTEFTR